jgi:hypothetical protein
MASRAGIERAHLLRRGELLEAATVAWNVVEGIIAVVAGVLASSLVLIGFGIDAFVETASGAVVGWRLHAELRGHLADMSAWKTPDGVYVIGVTQHGPFSSRGTEVMERRAARIAGVLLLGLSGYIIVDAGRRLLGFGAEARGSLLGIMLPRDLRRDHAAGGMGETPHRRRARQRRAADRRLRNDYMLLAVPDRVDWADS